MRSRTILSATTALPIALAFLPMASHAQIAIYQADTAGETLTSAGGDLAHSFDNEVRGGSTEHTKSNATDVAMASGHHLVIYNTRFDSTGGNERSEIMGKLNLNGADLPDGWSQSYMRRQGGNDEVVNSGGAIINVDSAGDILQLRSVRTDTNTAHDMVRIGGANAIQLIKLDDAWPYIRLVGGAGSQALTGSQAWDEVTYNTELEKDAGFTFTTGTPDITLDAAGHYLIMANTYHEMVPNGNRDGCVQRVTLDGSEVSGSLTTTYIRGEVNADGCLSGVTATGMIIEATAGQVLNIEIQQRSNQNVNITEDKTALSIVKFPDGVDYIRLEDLLAKQNINPSSLTALNYDDAGSQLELDSAFSHSVSTDQSRITVNSDGDYLFLATQFVSPEDKDRAFYNQGWQINGSGGMLGYGQTGNYARNSGVEATGNWSGFVAGLNVNDYIETVSVQLGNTGNLFGVLSLQGIKIDSLFGPDLTAPDIASLSPADDASGVFVATDLVLSFDEDVTLTGSGTVTIKNLDDGTGSSDISYDLSTATEATLVGRDLIINPASNLAAGTNFAVQISADAVEDQAAVANAFPGILDDATWNFATVAADASAPVLTTNDPVDEATNLPSSTNIVATFDEDVLADSGDITIVDLTAGTDTRTIAVTDTSQVSFAGAIMTVNPSPPLQIGKSYAVQISSTAVTNLNALHFAGIANTTTWNFTIIADLLTVYEPFDYPVGGLNGATGSSELGFSAAWTAQSASLVVEDSLFDLVERTGGSIGGLGGGSNRFGGARTIDPSALTANGLLADGSSLYFSVDLGYDTGGNLTNSRLVMVLGTEGMRNANYAYYFTTPGATGMGVTLGRFGSNGKVVATQVRDSTFGGSGFGGNVFGSEVAAQFTSGGQNGVIVGKLTWGATPGDDETLELFRPDPADFTNEAAATLLSTLTVPGVDQTAYDTISWSRGDKVVLDEIRYGTSWNAVTPLDATDPLLASVSPLGTGTPPNGDDGLFRATFDEPVEALASPTGSIVIRNAGDDSIFTTIPVTDVAQVSFSGKNLDITPAILPVPGNSYYIEIEPGALQDPAGNPFAGYTGSATWNFTTDSTAPMATITDNSVNGEVFLSLQPSITYILSFDEVITTSAGVSDFEILGSATTTIDSVTQTSGTTVEVVATATGVGTMNLNVKASASFLDGVGNSLDGPFADAETITVRDISPLSNQLGVLDLTANNGVNPATGNLWQSGDTYRFAFVTLATIDATSTDAATYNAFVQGAADASSLNIGATQGVTWKAIVSTSGDGGSIPAVAARDNTSTNPGTDGFGEAIYLLNGTTKVVDSYADLWDGDVDNRIDRTEEFALRAGDTEVWAQYAAVWTGTTDNGTASNPLGGATVRHGLARAEANFWESRTTAANTVSLPLYGLSVPLSIGSTAANPYDAWASANGLSGGDADASADTESPTPDGLVQLLEFAFGTDPSASDNVPLTVTDGATFTPGTPAVEQIFSGGNPVRLRYVRRKDHVAAGLTYTPQFSDSLNNFVPDPDDPVPTVVSDADGDYEVVEVPFPLFDAGGEKAANLFGQVEVTLAP